MAYVEDVKKLARTTTLTNAEIAAHLGCSRRTVRRIVGKYTDRIKYKIAGENPSEVIKPAKAARILLFDIENSPMEVYVWQLFKNNYIDPANVIKDWAILGWSAKWLFEPEIHSMTVTPEEAVNRDDSSILLPLWELLNEANIVIAHNASAFDIKKTNTRFILNGYQPPMPYRVVDTLSVAKRVFKFSSFKLDYLNHMLGIQTKGHHSMQMWRDCVHGDAQALIDMEEYNRTDVVALEELYLQIRPWVKSHPNLALYIDTDEERCTNCGNTDLDWGGFYYTPAGRFKAFRCGTCGAVGRSRYSDLTAEDKERLCLAVAT